MFRMNHKEKNSAYLPLERQQRIINILKQEFSIRSSNLSDLFGVSEMTIRRDLDLLEQQGIVERTHGGAALKQERVTDTYHYRSSIHKNPEQKERIAKMAASMVEPNDIIYIGEGTTASMIVRFIDPGTPFTLFTNNLGVISEAESVNLTSKVVLLPGIYNPRTHAVAGPLTMEMIRQVNSTKAFLGADGLSISAGMTTPDPDIAVIERTMAQHTQGQVIVMADHPKFGKVAAMTIIPLKHIDALITNRKIPADFQSHLDGIGIEILIAA